MSCGPQYRTRLSSPPTLFYSFSSLSFSYMEMEDGWMENVGVNFCYRSFVEIEWLSLCNTKINITENRRESRWSIWLDKDILPLHINSPKRFEDSQIFPPEISFNSLFQLLGQVLFHPTLWFVSINSKQMGYFNFFMIAAFTGHPFRVFQKLVITKTDCLSPQCWKLLRWFNGPVKVQ